MSALSQTMGLSRANWYRWLAPGPSYPAAMELRNAMQQIALEFPAH